MDIKSILFAAAATSLMLGPAAAQEVPSARPSNNGWDAGWFKYAETAAPVVRESTPTPAQLSFHGRPPQLPAVASASRPAVVPESAVKAKPVTVGEVNIIRLQWTDPDGDVVPALLCTPRGGKGPFPVVVAVHGLNSNKAQVCGQVAPALTKRGFAVLAPDMPVHGERPGSPGALLQKKDWISAIALHRRAVIDIRQAIDVAQSRPELDASGGVTLAGYSMGSWLDSIAGSADDRVKAMVLMVGGATDTGSVVRLFPQLMAADPLLALPHFAGRPLLMLNGLSDATVTPEMANRLYAAAAEPKRQKWYTSGHLLPETAYDDAAAWVAETWKTMAKIGT